MSTGVIPEPSVRVRGIVKRFGTFVANSAIDLDLAPGRIHAIVGENGAGKSTLMKILSGELTPDEGTIDVDGVRTSFRSPREAQRAGIGIVHQHFLLADAMRYGRTSFWPMSRGAPSLSTARPRVRASARSPARTASTSTSTRRSPTSSSDCSPPA